MCYKGVRGIHCYIYRTRIDYDQHMHMLDCFRFVHWYDHHYNLWHSTHYTQDNVWDHWTWTPDVTARLKTTSEISHQLMPVCLLDLIPIWDKIFYHEFHVLFWCRESVNSYTSPDILGCAPNRVDNQTLHISRSIEQALSYFVELFICVRSNFITKKRDGSGSNNFLGSLQVANTDVFKYAFLIFSYFVSVTTPFSIKFSKNVD